MLTWTTKRLHCVDGRGDDLAVVELADGRLAVITWGQNWPSEKTDGSDKWAMTPHTSEPVCERVLGFAADATIDEVTRVRNAVPVTG